MIADYVNDGCQIGVYKINSPSGKFYVGLTTKSFEDRWGQHIKDLKSGKHRSKGLQYAYNKYGIDSLLFEILESWDKPCSEKEYLELSETIHKREQYWYDLLKKNNVPYHSRPTGTGSVFHSSDTKTKISDSLIGINPIENECEICTIVFMKNPLSSRNTCSNTCLIISRRVQDGMSIENAKKIGFRQYHKENYGVFCTYCGATLAASNLRSCSVNCKEQRAIRNKSISSKEVLEELYVKEQLSTTQIANKLGCSQPAVLYRLKKYGIPTRSKSPKGYRK